MAQNPCDQQPERSPAGNPDQHPGPGPAPGSFPGQAAGPDAPGAPGYERGQAYYQHRAQTAVVPRTPPPPVVRRAVLLIWIGCGLALAGEVVEALREPMDGFGPVEAAFGIAVSVVVHALGAVFGWLALRGYDWARITSLVFACIAALGLVASTVLIGLALIAEPGTVPLSLVGWLGSVAYVFGNVLLWLRSSSAWYRGGVPVRY